MLISEHPVKIVAYMGATGRPFRLAIVDDDDGSAINLTGYTGVYISAKLGATYKMGREAMTIDDAATGRVSYLPDAAEIDTVGEYKAMIRLVDGSGLIDFTEPFVIDVRDPVDSA